MSQEYFETECDPQSIHHDGIIKNIDEKYYYVSIIVQSACASCQVKSVCNITEIQEEIIEVPKNNEAHYKVGDKIKVLMEKSLGPKAIMLGYFIPFLLLIITLIISLAVINSEGIAGILSLTVLIPYYLILYKFKDQLKKTFVFRIS